MKQKIRINFIHLGIVLSALVLSACITFIIHRHVLPWKLQVVEAKGSGTLSVYFFHDLNHDGFSELYNHDSYNNCIVFYNYQGAVIDQFNLKEPIGKEGIFFDDYTGDGYDECFVFTVNEDALYLYVFDIANRKTILARQFLMKIPNPHPYFIITNARLYDLHNDFTKELLFTVHAGLAMKPRGLYAYDLKNKTIIQRFENNATKEKMVIYDLDGDGQDEIIIVSKANGNGAMDVPFTDWKNWIFILNQDFELVATPMSFGEYPSVIAATPVQTDAGRFILIAHYRAGTKYANKPLGLYLVDNRERFVRERYFEVKNMTGLKMAVDNPENLQGIFITPGVNQLFFIDRNFNLIRRKDISNVKLKIEFLHDLDMDGKAELITSSAKGMEIFDQEFNLLTRVDIKGFISLRYCGPDSKPQIGISAEDNFYQFRLVENPLFNWLWALFTVLFISISGLLFLGDRLLTRLSTFFNYFMYSLKKTRNAVILLSPNGRISYFNSRVQTLFMPNEPLIKKRHFHQVFSEYPSIVNAVRESLKIKKAVQKDLSISKGRINIQGKLSVIPFKTRFHYVYAYLVEI